MKIVLKRFDEFTLEEFYRISKLRTEIFVVEQKCPYLELDGEKDYKSLHLYFLDEKQDEIICYCRIIPKGLSYPTVAFGRVLTNERYRGKGYAREMLKKAIEIVRDELREKEITLGGQSHLKEFYSSLGFKPISDIYDDEGIPHIDMKLVIK